MSITKNYFDEVDYHKKLKNLYSVSFSIFPDKKKITTYLLHDCNFYKQHVYKKQLHNCYEHQATVAPDSGKAMQHLKKPTEGKGIYQREIDSS